MVARVPVHLARILREHDPTPPRGRPERSSQPLIVYPRPYESPGLLPGFPASVDAYLMLLVGIRRFGHQGQGVLQKSVGERATPHPLSVPIPPVSRSKAPSDQYDKISIRKINEHTKETRE